MEEGFEIYAAPLAGGSDPAWEKELASDIAAIFGSRTPEREGNFYHVINDEGSVHITLLPPGGEWVWSVFENHPLVVEIAARGKWANVELLAHHLFASLDGLSKYELLLVHDLEEYVNSNFDFPERMEMAIYSPGGGSPSG
jgi:hypothetical protein